MKSVPFYDIDITGGFYADKQKTVREKTVWAVYDRFKDTGRIGTMDCKKQEIRPHHFWGSDVVKWMEGAAYILEKSDDEKLRSTVDEIVDMIESGVDENGYYNSYFNNPEIDEEIFTNRDRHELYSLGHMVEAGVALYHATGDRKLLDICIKNVELVDKIFRKDGSASFVTPGHEEIELALIRLWQTTKDKRFLELSEFFVRERGNNAKDGTVHVKDSGEYTQSHLPVTEQREAKGHAVRAVYLYCAIADLAKELGDEKLFESAKALFDDIYEKKMYITGAIGALAQGEAFSVPFHLPNRTAYAETCAALGLALFARRLYLMEADGRYGDAAERALYNGMIAGMSLEGDAFFYENPLEIDLERRGIPHGHDCATERKVVFGCSCCPPNIVRFIPSVADFIYTYDDNNLYVHQYMANVGKADGHGVCIKTEYPLDSAVHVKYDGDKKLVLRKPAWCKDVKTESVYTEKNGYLYFDTNEVDIEFGMEPTFYVSSDAVHENEGRVALMRGPVVYCLEEKDQCAPLSRLRVDASAPVRVTDETYGGFPILEAKGYILPENKPLYSPFKAQKPTECVLKFIPHYTFANRGADNMKVWLLDKSL